MIVIFYHIIDLLIIFWSVGALVRAIYYQQLLLPFRLYIDGRIFKEIAKAEFPIYTTAIIGFVSSQGD